MNIRSIVTEIFDLDEEKDNNHEELIIQFLKDNPFPEDSELHAWAEEQGLNVHEVETQIYKLATLFVKFWTGGRANKKGLTLNDIPKDELKKGIQVELEHLDNDDVFSKMIAARISLDHWAESQPESYYDPLLDMEKIIEKKKSA